MEWDEEKRKKYMSKLCMGSKGSSKIKFIHEIPFISDVE